MKKLFYLAMASLFVLTACNQEPTDGYVVKGHIHGDFQISEDITGQIILTNRHRTDLISDTTSIEKGKFQFEGKVETPEMYYLMIQGVDDIIPLFLENASYKVNITVDDYKNAEIIGGENHVIYSKIVENNKAVELKHKLDELMTEYRDSVTTKERREEISSIFEEASKERDSFKEELLKSAPVSYFMLNDIASSMIYDSLEELEEKFTPFRGDERFAANRNYESIESRIEGLKKLQPGMPAPDFTQNTPEGKPISLSDIYPKYKVTMIDFWAGWCGPCRQFNPTLVEIYKKYHAKGFEILGVSFDRDRETWLKAIKDDKLPWLQISDVKYWDTAPRYDYLINFIPNNAFVDSEGKIIARSVEKDKIEALLDEYLK